MTEAVEDEFTEMFDAEIPRVDLVGKGANGVPFLIAKSDGSGLMPAAAVRALIGPADDTPPAGRDDVTITGSPAAVMKMIHEAAQRASTPNLEGGDTQMDDVTKADAPAVEVTDLVADAPGGTTADTLPGSPDWEGLDAETALNAISVLGRVKGALGWLADREAQEAVVGGEMQDSDNAFDLQDAACQIDCIIRRLAGFAATETLGSDVSDEIEDVTKAITAAGDLSGPLAVIETYGPVRKAGRVLSAANEQAIRDASASLEKVLASLPAPIDDTVVKSEETPVTKSPEERHGDALALIRKAAVEGLRFEVEKAGGDPVVAVYDADGNLVGTIDPGDLNPIAAPTPPEGGETSGPSADDAPAAEDAAAAAAPAADATAAEEAATIPGTDTVAAPAPTDDDVQKATQAAFSAALAEAIAPLAEGLGKHAELADVVKGLKEQVEKMALMPDDRKAPLLNGGTGTAGLAGREAAESDEFVALQKAVEDAKSPAEKAQATQALAYAKVRDRFTQ